jgi:hypothetical protein
MFRGPSRRLRRGVDGYHETLERLRDPDDEDHEATKTWIESMTGGPFEGVRRTADWYRQAGWR